MSYERNMKWLNDRQIIYRKNPINDEPTYNNDQYSYYANGTHEYYYLFNSPSKITTYRSLKWHMLVLYYLNMDNIINSDFVTFFIKNKILEDMIKDVLQQGGDPPKNRARKIIFKDYSGLSFEEKMKIVGQLSGRQKLDKNKLYITMFDINDCGEKITNKYLAELSGCSIRTIQRHMCVDLKQEKQRLNEEI